MPYLYSNINCLKIQPAIIEIKNAMPITLITGANSGMGYETALSLGKLGHELILCARSLEKGNAALHKMKQQDAAIKATVFSLDLASFQSIKAGAEKINAAYPSIDYLIFNAGVMTPPYTQTEDGFELQFQANYLGHFYLFNLLKQTLLASAIRKVISISSLSSEKGVNDSIEKYRADVYCSSDSYDAMKCYRESKLAQVLFIKELNRRFQEYVLNSYAVHPGVVNTSLFYRNSSSLYVLLMKPFVWAGYVTGQLATPRKGAETAIYLASNQVNPSGHYWADKKLKSDNPIANQDDFCREFWDWSLSLVPQCFLGDRPLP